MSKSYIKILTNEDGELCAELHTNGKYKKIPPEKMPMLKLAGLCNRQSLAHEGFVRNEEKAINIINSYENLRKAQVIITHLGEIPYNAIIKAGIAGTLIISGANMIQGKGKESEDKFYLTPENEVIKDQEQPTESINENNEEQTIEIDDSDITATVSEENEYETSISSTYEKEVPTFNFEYESRVESESMQNVQRYKDIFQNVADTYGLDANLLMAIAAQESGGLHEENLYNGPAAGIMQIEKVVHLGAEHSAYNFKTGEYDSIYVDEAALENIETNITIAAMIFKSCLQTFDYNIPIALQAYNFGPGSTYQVLSMCSELEGIETDDLINDSSNNKWLSYREFLQTGDPEYVEHVLSYLDSDKITVLNDEGEQITVNINNNYEKGFTH